MSRQRVAIVQEYVPKYRVKFFAGLVEALREAGMDCVIVAGHPAGSQAVRGDAIEDVGWLRLAHPRRLKLGSRVVHFYGTDRHWRDCDGVIMEFRGTSLDLSGELLRRRKTGRRVGVWGHIKPFTQRGHPVDLFVERYQMRSSDHVFAYTSSGAEFAVTAGVEPEKVTTVMNSIDVAGLIAEFESIESSDIQEFRIRHGVRSGKTFGYIGGLDASKRIEFLVEALDVLWRQDAEIKVLLGGRGDQEGLLARAVERGQVVPLGYVDAKGKALIARTSRGLINPGRIGLLAVESMALGLPILTTDWDYHGPEYEYLKSGIDVFSSADDVSSFVELVTKYLMSGDNDHSRSATRYPTVDDMIGNFAAGVTAMMS